MDEGEDLFFLLDAYAHYSNGYLLVGSAVWEIPAKLADAMAVLGDELENCREEKDRDRRSRSVLADHQEKVERGAGD